MRSKLLTATAAAVLALGLTACNGEDADAPALEDPVSPEPVTGTEAPDPDDPGAGDPAPDVPPEDVEGEGVGEGGAPPEEEDVER